MKLQELLEHSIEYEVDVIYISPPTKKYFFRLLGEDEGAYVDYKKNRDIQRIYEMTYEKYMVIKEEIIKKGNFYSINGKGVRTENIYCKYKGKNNFFKVNVIPQKRTEPKFSFVLIKNKSLKK